MRALGSAVPGMGWWEGVLSTPQPCTLLRHPRGLAHSCVYRALVPLSSHV